jgi:hypothetical protein
MPQAVTPSPLAIVGIWASDPLLHPEFVNFERGVKDRDHHGEITGREESPLLALGLPLLRQYFWVFGPSRVGNYMCSSPRQSCE